MFCCVIVRSTRSILLTLNWLQTTSLIVTWMPLCGVAWAWQTVVKVHKGTELFKPAKMLVINCTS